MAARQNLIFEVRLMGVKPAPWRRFSLPRDGSFFDLHVAIQDACGWEDCHLWQFTDSGEVPIAGMPDDVSLEPLEDSDPDAKQVRLLDWFRLNKRCSYIYDFGDDWRHTVELAGVETLAPPACRRLLAGKWSFPPEDCGGAPGYERCVRAARTGHDPWDQDGFLEWLDGWQPEGFDLKQAKALFERG